MLVYSREKIPVISRFLGQVDTLVITETEKWNLTRYETQNNNS